MPTVAKSAAKSAGPAKEVASKGVARKAAQKTAKKSTDTTPPPEPTPVQKPLHEQLIDAATNADVAEVQRLLDAGADAKFVYSQSGTWGAMEEYSALSRVMGRYSDNDDWKEVAVLLLKAGADPNRAMQNNDWRGCGGAESAFQKLLSRAADDARLLSAFLDAGANPNMAERHSRHSMRTDGESVTYPLHRAANRGNFDCVAALLAADADPKARQTNRVCNERGHNQDSSETALHIAAKHHDMKESTKMAEILISHGAEVDAVMSELKTVESEIYAKLSEEERADLHDDPRDPSYICPITQIPVRKTALHIAIHNGNTDLARLLVKHGANPSAKYSEGSSEKTALELAEGNETMLCALRGVQLTFGGRGFEDLADDTPLEEVGISSEATIDVGRTAPVRQTDRAEDVASGMTVYLRFTDTTLPFDLQSDATIGDLRRLAGA